MKLSQYAKKVGVSYKTAYRWYRAGTLDADKTATGIIIVRDTHDEKPLTGRIALYARVASIGQKEDVERQLERLKDYAAAKGYQVAKEVTEIASGLNDRRPKLEKLLADTSIGTIVIESRDRLTRFGSHYIETLLEAQGRHLEMIFQSDTGDELVDDFVRVITSMAARIYGRRHSKRRAEKIKQCIEHTMQEEEEEEEETR
ncbi:MAG TPA: IS607 family transposase [Ktedonobacteraceae bacterium]|nr:IS607 family transposase [Ktedonobacteraceae bacterium]